MRSFILAVTFVLTQSLHAQFAVSDYFHPVGPSESLVAKFDHSIEATTANQYSGYVSAHFSGYGYNNPGEAFDAFYFFFSASSVNWQPRKQGLGIAFDGSLVIDGSRTLYEKDLANNTDITNPANSLWQIMFNNDVGPYDGLNIYGFPNYHTDHEYDIVLFINSGANRTINFGFLDGGLTDNTGQVLITLTPVEIGAVPEPSCLLIAFIGIAICYLTRRKRRFFIPPLQNIVR